MLTTIWVLVVIKIKDHRNKIKTGNSRLAWCRELLHLLKKNNTKLHHLRSARKQSAVRRGVCVPGAGWPLINMFEWESNAFRAEQKGKKTHQLKLDGPILPEISRRKIPCLSPGMKIYNKISNCLILYQLLVSRNHRAVMIRLVKMLGSANGKWALTNLSKYTEKLSILGREHLLATTDPKGPTSERPKARAQVKVK